MQKSRCPACGATLLPRSATTPPMALACGFCQYEIRKTKTGKTKAGIGAGPLSAILPEAALKKSLLRLQRLCDGATVFLDGAAFPLDGTVPYDPEETGLTAIFAPQALPFEDDLNDWFRQRYKSLERGGFLMILAPVKSRLASPSPRPGQHHLFGPRSLMYLLERHGFKLYWKSRFRRNPLALIARKM